MSYLGGCAEIIVIMVHAMHHFLMGCFFTSKINSLFSEITGDRYAELKMIVMADPLCKN